MSQNTWKLLQRRLNSCDLTEKILTEQYGSAMALELANLHNGLSLWRQTFLEHHVQNNMSVQRAIEIEAAANKNIFAELQKTHNTLLLRYGLLAT